MVTFEHVSFSYNEEGKEAQIIDDLNFRIKKLTFSNPQCSAIVAMESLLFRKSFAAFFTRI